MAFIINIIIQIIIALIIATIFSKPQDTFTKPAGFSDFDFPTASQSRSIPVVWGRQELKAPNLVWAGDFQVIELTESVRAGLKKHSITVGYTYYMGMQLALCMGGPTVDTQVASISKLRFGDKVAWTGTPEYSVPSPIPDPETGELAEPVFVQTHTPALPLELHRVENRNLYGGDKGGGGLVGNFRLYAGERNPDPDTYLAAEQGEFNTGHSEVAYVMWYGPTAPVEADISGRALAGKGYVANSPTLSPMWFTVDRYPNTLGLTGGKERIGNNCNPACMIHELLTNEVWGAGLNSGVFGVGDLEAMADVLVAEGLGLAMTWDNEKSLEDMVEVILTHIGGYYYEDKLTGKMRFGLFRDDYDPELLDTLGRPNVLSVPEYTRTGWEGSINEVIVTYADPERNYELNLVSATDVGNSFIQGKPVSRTNQYHGVTDKAIATQLAFRDLRNLSLPLTRAVIVTDRSTGTWEVGKVFKWTEEDLGIVAMIMRITKVERGDYTNPEITIHCLEDVFGLGDAVFAPPTDSEWIPPNFTPQLLEDVTVIELPRALSEFPDDLDRAEMMGIVPQTASNNVGYETYKSTDINGLAANGADIETFTAHTSALSGLKHDDPSYDAASTLELAGSVYKLEIGAGASTDALLLVDNEFIAYDSHVVNMDGTVTVTGLYRGMLNSVVSDHISGTRVIIFDGSGYDPKLTYVETDELFYRFVPQGLSGSFRPEDVPKQSHVFIGEKLNPYVLTDFKVDTVYSLEPKANDMDPVLTFGNNPRDADNVVTGPNIVNAALTVDTTYVCSILGSGNYQYATQDLAVLQGSTSLNEVTFDWSASVGGGGVIPPYVWYTVQAKETASTRLSTYMAAKLQTILAAPHEDILLPLNEPINQVMFFDGLTIGAQNGL